MKTTANPVKPSNTRHWTTAIYLQLGIRIRYAYESWGGIKPLFYPIAAYPSPFRPKNCPQYDLITRLGFTWLWFFVGVSRELLFIPYALLSATGLLRLVNYVQQALADRLIAQFEAAGYTEAQREVPIPEFDWKNKTPEEFYNTFVKRPHPVVLRGFMKDQALLKELSWDSILQKYGEEDVFLTKKELDGFPGKLKEVENPGVYLHNSEKLFNKYPELRNLPQYERLEPFLKMKAGYEQLFVGRQGTGSPFHNASVYNMFYQVSGKKTWWFIDPTDTLLGYPLIIFGRAAGILMCLWPDEYNKEAFPLFKYCPVYKSTLEPGDVLFNPPWWWHSIKNVTESTVGIASRWHTNGICGETFNTTEEDWEIYRTGSLFFLLGRYSWGFLHGILQTPSPKFDEHVSLREKNNRYVHHQIKIHENGGFNLFGSVGKF